MKYCTKCGNQMQDDMRFCPSCGADFDAALNPAAAPQTPVAAPQEQAAAPQAPVAAPQEQAAAPQAPVPPYQAPAQQAVSANRDANAVQPAKSSKKPIIIIAVAVAVLLIGVAVAYFCGLFGNKDDAENESTAAETVSESTEAESVTENINSGIAKDYHSGQIMIDGELITLPVKVSDFTAKGWNLSGYDDTIHSGYQDYTGNVMLEPEPSGNGIWEAGRDIYLTKGSTRVDAKVASYTKEPAELNDTYIVKIESNEGEVTIPGGFVTGKAAVDEILKAWGEPDYDSNNPSYRYLEYKDDNVANYTLRFDENGIMNEVELFCNNNSSIPQDKIIVDVDAVNSIADNDTFPVKVKELKVVKDGFKEGGVVSLKGDDALLITLENGDSMEVTNVEIYIVDYNENHEIAEVDTGFSNMPITYGKKLPFVKVVTNENGSFAAGESNDIALRFKASDTNTTCAIVYKYTTADGQEHVNPAIEDWVDAVFS